MDEFLEKFFALIGLIITFILALIGIGRVDNWLSDFDLLRDIVDVTLFCIVGLTIGRIKD